LKESKFENNLYASFWHMRACHLETVVQIHYIN